MQLSAMQRQFLEIYIRHHAEPPTAFSLVAEMMHFRRAWKVLLQWVAIGRVAGAGPTGSPGWKSPDHDYQCCLG